MKIQTLVLNQKNNKMYRISNHLQLVMSAICCLYTLYVYTNCTSASNFLEYIKILPVNKKYSSCTSHTSTSGAKRQDPQRCKSTKL
jgi:hypothetical protein